MNEQPTEAYLNFIEQLLNCTSEAKLQKCFADNQELLDRELVQVMNQVAARLEQNWQQRQANYLNSLAAFLSLGLGISENERSKLSTPNPEDYFNFLIQVLQATEESNSNPKVVYSLLQNNLDKLDETFAEELYQWAITALPPLESEQAYGIARVIGNFSYLIKNFPLGSKASNLEIAIKADQAVISVFTPDSFPYEWASTKNNLGIAYGNRIKGERAESLEAAIACFRDSLKVFTSATFPYEWANTQHNLGNAYTERIKGERAENLEAAITCFRESLKIRTANTFPYKWARTKNNLGLAYTERIKGERAENLEAAIACFRDSLKVFTSATFPYEWANTQTNLGIAYGKRIKGERAENLEAAIVCFRESLEILTLNAFPYEWARTKNNLGIAYTDRIKGERAENLETAIACFRESLNVYTPNEFPYDWANTQNILGRAYWDRIKGERADNLEAAIACYQDSLNVYTFGAFPYEWARTKNNLGIAYTDRIKGERAENLETAIAYFRESLEIRTPGSFPYEWANTQTNLGRAYGNRIKGERAENLEAAIACFRESLKVYTPNDFPQDCLLTERNLGDLSFEEGNWQLAIEAYNRAIEAVEISRSWAMTPQSKQEVMEAAIDVYHNIVQASLNTEQIPQALEYIERSKTRNLVELLATRDLKPKGDFSPSIVRELDRLRHDIRTKQIYLANQERTYSALSRLRQPSQLSLPDRTHLKELKKLEELQQELDELIERDISPIDPTFHLTQKVEPIPFSDIQSLIDERTAIVEWYITGDKILTFLVTHHSSHPQVWQSSTEDWTNLVNWVNEYLETYYTNRQQWIAELETHLPNLAEILHLDEILSDVPPECDHLILIPHRFLHLLPLHALPVSPQLERRAGGEGKYLLDLFPRGVQYAPSCQLLKLAQSQQRPDFCNLFAIQNPTIPDPTKQLLFTDLEVETISSFFPDPEVLAKEAATEEAVKKYPHFPSVHCVHFSCHGEFNLQSPLESALILANKEHWTLGEIFELSLPQCRLVTLSACETGVTDFNSLSDEYIGLPNGFLFAGSPSVLSSLWTVDELSTTLLMIKFYENLRQFPQRQAGDVAVALQTAQQWLRDLTIEQLDTFLEQYKPQVEKTLAQWRKGQRLRFEKSLEFIRQHQPQPFVNPYYWAAFIAIGF